MSKCVFCCFFFFVGGVQIPSAPPPGSVPLQLYFLFMGIWTKTPGFSSCHSGSHVESLWYVKQYATLSVQVWPHMSSFDRGFALCLNHIVLILKIWSLHVYTNPVLNPNTPLNCSTISSGPTYPHHPKRDTVTHIHIDPYLLPLTTSLIPACW